MKPKILSGLSIIFLIFLGCLSGCIEKYPIPPQKDVSLELAEQDTLYLQQEPVWDAEHGYNFNAPQDILIGWDTWIYIADTGNDRIVALDLYGNVVGISQPLSHPVAITQDDSLNLFVVCNNNVLLRINLFEAGHNLGSAAIDTVYYDIDHPQRRFTGVCAFRFQSDPDEREMYSRYYVTSTGPDEQDNQILFFKHDALNKPKGHVPLEYNGFGLMAAAGPSGIARYYEGKERQDERGSYKHKIDFIFTQTGENYYRVQGVTTGSESEFIYKFDPGEGKVDLLSIGKFIQPQDVTIDGEYSIYVVDAAKDSLFKFSSNGTELQSFGGTGSGPNQLNHPNGVAHHHKTLYIADTGNNRIVRFKLSTDIQ